MARSSKESFKALYEIAQSQQGFFTTKQAISAGFTDPLHAYHVQQGNWIREHRGIYRLASFPNTERPDLMLWYLWSRNRDDVPQGAFSHQTALGIHDLSDLNPSRFHLTVPKRFRRNSAFPKPLLLHFDDLPPDDTEIIHGVRVTQPLRTILDLARQGEVEEGLLIQALKEGMKRGVVTLDRVEEARRNTPIGSNIDRLLKKVRRR